MSRQTIITCDRCGAEFHEVSYEVESRVELSVSHHRSDVSTGHKLREYSYDLCPKCSKAFFKFLNNE